MKINKCPSDEQDVRNWEDLNKRFDKREQAFAEIETLIKEKGIIQDQKENQYYWECWKTLNKAFYTLILNNIEQIEANKNNFIVDFDELSRNQDGSMEAKIWVQPANPTIHKPHFGKFDEIKIYGLLLNFRISIINREIPDPPQQAIRFSLHGHINPDHWQGRNELDYNAPGKTITTAFSRLIVFEAKKFDQDFLDKINTEFSSYFYAAMRNYFL
jgi:hypothetical protein